MEEETKLIDVITMRDNKEEIYKLNAFDPSIVRPTLTEIHIADLHFGAMDPKYQYDILCSQVLDKIEPIHFDIFSINGDIFDHKFMSNADPIMYAISFVDRVVDMCRRRQATLVILAGTLSHDAQQLKLFYHYLNDKTVDVRIVETVQFQYIKGAKVLCIPELYDRGANFYNYFLEKQQYDTAFVHGTMKDSVYGANKENLGSDRYPVFSIESFRNCLGPIISGHVHTPGCFAGYYYYCGSPYRWVFGQEEEKGFLICLHNLETRWHYMHFEPIKCMRYDTVNVDSYIDKDPKELIEYVKQLQDSGIDNVRLEFTQYSKEFLDLIRNYYRNNSTVAIKAPDNRKAEMMEDVSKEIEDKYKEYQYIFDPSLSAKEVILRYINQQKGYEYMTEKDLAKVFEEGNF